MTSSLVSVQEFERWLQQGLGRVALFLQESDATPYREAILYACLHNLAYDRQCEETRGDYLYEIIQRTGEFDWYRAQLLAALTADSETPQNAEDEAEEKPICGYQLCEMARRMAQAGDREARQALYQEFVRDAAQGEYCVGDEIILLDGFDGLRFIAQHLDKLDWENDAWSVDNWFEKLEAKYGAEMVERVMENDRRERGNLHELWDRRQEHKSQWAQEREERQAAPKAPLMSFAELHQKIQTGVADYGDLYEWRRRCKDDLEFERAAWALLAEQDSERLEMYARIFQRRPFPLDPAPLVALSHHEDIGVAHWILRVLENITHPAVRRRGLELLEEPERRGFGIDLLNANYEPGDTERVTEALRHTEDEYYHGIVLGARRFCEDHAEEERTEISLLIYEYSPCSLCRSGAIDLLLEDKALPDWIRAECRYDADLSIRQAVAEA